MDIDLESTKVTPPANPEYRLVPWMEAKHADRENGNRWSELDRSMLRYLKPGDLVVLLVEARNLPSKFPEMIWVIIQTVNKQTKAIDGLVNTRMERTPFHGVRMGMPIRFYVDDIVDVGVNFQRTGLIKPGNN